MTSLLLLRDKMEEAGLPRTFCGPDRVSEAQLFRTVYALLARVEALEDKVEQLQASG